MRYNVATPAGFNTDLLRLLFRWRYVTGKPICQGGMFQEEVSRRQTEVRFIWRRCYARRYADGLGGEERRGRFAYLES